MIYLKQAQHALDVSKRAYVELALIKMMEHQTLKQIDYEATILDLKHSIQELKEQAKNQPRTVEKSTLEPLVTSKDIESILNKGNKDKRQYFKVDGLT